MSAATAFFAATAFCFLGMCATLVILGPLGVGVVAGAGVSLAIALFLFMSVGTHVVNLFREEQKEEP